MGQYYKPLLEAENGDRIVIDNYLDGNYYVAKLMEHSWFLNDFVLSVASLLYGTKKKLAWVGDYADSDKDNFPKIPVTELHEEVWKSEVTFKELKTTDFSLSGKYFVNHTLKEYIGEKDTDIKDPYGYGNIEYENCLKEIVYCVDKLIQKF